MSTPPASRRSSRPATRRRLLGAAAIAVAMAAVACAPDPGPAPNPDPSLRSVSNAVLEWTISREADNASLAPGIVNYWSAGRSDGTAATYVPTNGNVTVQKKNAAGSFVPIGSEPAVSWANKNRDGNGNLVTATNAFFLGQRVRYTGGTGTVNTATGAATIRWSGTFTVNFYGSYTPFWIVDPTLTVDAGGAARLTATIGGRGSSQENPDIQITLPDTPGITLAEFADVFGGFSRSFAQLMLLSLTVFCCTLVLAVLAMGPLLWALYRAGVFAGAEPDPTQMVGPLLVLPVLMLPLLYLSIGWLFAPLLVIDRGMGFWEAMETSRRMINKR